MITLENRRLCESCFTSISGEPCPVCGFSRAGYTPKLGVLPVGSILTGKYIIGQVIGQGGFGITYRAYDIKREQIIAIKEYYPSSLAARLNDRFTVAVTTAENEPIFRSGIEKFYEEARLVSRFNGNPNIVSVYEFFYENDTAYFAMEFLEGITLKSYVEKNGVLSPSQALYIFSEVSSALMIAHSANILHRDISPDNIMLCRDGGVKLIDFGAARQVLADNPKSMSVILKEGFAPLEQYQKRGKQGPWTDIYSLGATVYYALTRDFLDDPMTRLEDDGDFSLNKYEIEGQLWSVLQKAVQLKIEGRYQNAFELKEALKEIKYKPSPLMVTLPEVPSKTAPDLSGSAPGMPGLAGNTQGHAGNAPGYAGNTSGFAEAAPDSVHGNSLNGSVPNAVTANGSLQNINTFGAGAPVYTGGPADGPLTPEGKNNLKKPFKYKPLIIAGSAVLAAVIIIAVILAVSSGGNRGGRNPYPVIEDPANKEEPAEKIEIGGNLYDSDIEEINLTRMELTNYDIRNLPRFKNLKTIILNDNSISDLSVLSQMPQLEGIWFNNNMVSDISFAEGMKNLKYISFTGNRVSDLSPLEGTTGLESFWADDNRISDLSPLKGNKNMVEIGIHRNPIGGDISALSGMTGLTWISAEGCGLTDLYALRNCTELKYIYISYNSIDDVSPLTGCTGIAELYISYNTVQDKEGFIDSFDGITISYNGIVDLQIGTDDEIDGYVFASKEAAEEWKTEVLGENVDFGYTYYE